MKKVLLLFLALLLALPGVANSAAEDASQACLQTVWKAQTLEGLNEGIWVIPEAALNQYFAGSNRSELKNPTLKIMGDNNLNISFDSRIGRVGLTCEIKQFVHNQDESYAEVYVRKKEVANKPVVSWMLKFIPLGAIADLYGNPLKNVKDVDARLSGNTLKINFRPLVEKTLLSSDIGKKVEISSLTTREEALELHTNLKAADLLGLLMGNQQ